MGNIKKNFIYNAAYQVLALLIPIITTPYLSRTLGVDAIGIFSYTYSIVSFFTIVAVSGTTIYGQRLIAFNRDDKEGLSRSFWEVFLFRLTITVMVLAIYGIFVFNTVEYRFVYLTMSLNIINVIFDITWFYQGIEDFKKIVIRNMLVKILNLISIFLFIKSEDDLIVYSLLYCGYIIIGNLSTWIGIKKKITFVNAIHPFKNLKDIFLLFIPTVAMQVYTILDKAMIGWFTSSTYENGCYEQAEKICRIAVTVVAALATVISPRVANLYGKAKNGECQGNEIIDLLYKGICYGCAIAVPIMMGIIAVTPVFVPVFFGEGYDKIQILLPIFSILVLAVGLANIVGIAYLIPTEQQNIYTIAVTISAIVNFLMNIILIPLLLSVGAAIASVVAESIGIAIQMFCCITKNNMKIRYILAGVWKYFSASIVMLMAVILLRDVVQNNWIGLFILIILGVIIYSSMLIILKDELLISNCRNIYVNYLLKNKRRSK